MARSACFPARSLLGLCLLAVTAAGSAAADAAKSKLTQPALNRPDLIRPDTAKPDAAKPDVAEPTEPEKKAAASPAKPKPELSPEMAALRDRVRRTLGLYYRQSFNTRDHTAGEMLLACLPFGCQTEVVHGGERINGITCLCWNYPCAGYPLLSMSGKRIAARVGYGFQTYPGQFLAMLALSRVPADYPIRVGEDVRTVADLVESEKLDCHTQADQSLRLLGLSYYVPGDQTWKDRLGETWSVDRLVDEELSQSLTDAPCGGTYRLLALSSAVARRAAKPPLSPTLPRAQKFCREFQVYAFQNQNADGSWHPAFFAAVGTTNDSFGQLRSTGHILQWLAFSLPEERLEESGLVNAVQYVCTLLGYQQPRWSAPGMSVQGIDAVMCGLYGLAVYDERYFRPRDPEPAAEEEQPAQPHPPEPPPP